MVSQSHDNSSNSGFVLPEDLNIHHSFSSIKEMVSEGFNQLYTAERFGKKWVLKGLKKNFTDQALYREFLKKELDILMTVDSQYIVKAFGMEDVPGLGPCIVMEYVDGCTLKELIGKGISKKLKSKIIEQLLEAVHYIHQKQIVHRDLKPSNIMVTNNGENIKLIDFGLADTDAYCILKQPAGTFRYMSPEQQEGRLPDIRNDIYSLGRILEDLKLGRRYAKIVHRCLLPSAMRYGDVEDLSKALQQAKLFRKRAGLTLLAVIFFSLIAYLYWQINILQKVIPAKEEVPTLVQEQIMPRYLPARNNKPDHRQSSPTTTSAQGKMSPAATNTNPEPQAMRQAISKGKKLLDNYIASTAMVIHMDTVSENKYQDNASLTYTIQKCNDIVTNYLHEIKPDFSSQQYEEIRNMLYAYLSEKYFNPWNRKLMDLADKERRDFLGE